MTFLGIIAVCSIVYPILFLSQRKKQHREIIDEFNKMKKRHII